MKRILLGTIILMIFITNYSLLGQEVKWNGKIDEDKTIGKVDSMIVTKYLAKFRDSIVVKREPREKKYKVLFDKKGVITNKTYIGYSDQLSDSYEYTYNKDGGITKEVSKNSNGENRFIIELTYDNNHKMIEEKHWSILGNNDKWIIKNNEIENTAIRYFTKGEGDFTSSSGTKYYFNKNDLIEKVEDDNYVWIYKYDDRNNLIFRFMDEKMQAINLDDNSKSNHISSIEMNYDSNSNIIRYIDKSRGKVNKDKFFTYEYDNLGNWIKKIEYWKDEPIYIFEREIFYK
ncbi:MAG: hypothetical protein HPY60_11930 [Candidatus Methanofastidiosum sp.]|nr:hypothetical protein [Methanofastidiosum sp.]